MVKRLFLYVKTIFFLSLISTSADAQILKSRHKVQKTGKIIFDFNSNGIRDTIFQYKNKGKDTLVEKTVLKLWYSRPSTFQVRINPYLYDVSVGARQVNDEGIVDSMAARLFLAALTTLSENKGVLDTAVKKTQQGTEVPKPQSADSVALILSKIIEASDSQESTIIQEIGRLDDASSIASITNIDSLKAKIKTEAGLDKEQSENFLRELQAIRREKRIFETYKIKREIFKNNLDSFLISVRNLENEYDICEYSTLLCLSDKLNNTQIFDAIQEYALTEKRDSLHIYLNELPGYLANYKNKMDACYKEVKYSYNDLSESSRPLKYFNLNYRFDSTLKDDYDSLYLSYNRVKPEVFVKGFTLMVRNLQNK